MNFAQHFHLWKASVVLAFSLLSTALTGECVISEPVRVDRICGQVVMQGHSLPGTLRLTGRDAKGSAKSFERVVKTDDEGKFNFKDVPAGKYEMRLTPMGMREVFVPVLVDLGRPQRDNACMKPIDLKLDFLPEPCVSPELRNMPK